VPALVGVLVLLICAVMVLHRRRRRLHGTTQPSDAEKMDLAASAEPSGPGELPTHIPSDHAAHREAQTALAVQHPNSLPDLRLRNTTDTVADAAPSVNAHLALCTRGHAMPRSIIGDLDQSGADVSADGRPRLVVPYEESTQSPLLAPVSDLEQASQTAADARVLAIPDPARDEVRAAQERAFAKFSGASAAHRSELAATSRTAQAADTSSTTNTATDATKSGDLNSQLSLLRRRVLDQQMQIDQMRTERLAEEQRQREDSHNERGSDAPPAYEGEAET
jgi:hypothetical protein